MMNPIDDNKMQTALSKYTTFYQKGKFNFTIVYDHLRYRLDITPCGSVQYPMMNYFRSIKDAEQFITELGEGFIIDFWFDGGGRQ
ncbi:hypothetical protein [Facklamia hominis]